MQTFLPYPSFAESAKCLDYKRLGKQRVEAMQIWNIVSDIQLTKGWIHHPAVTMWYGHSDALAHYTNTMIHEWKQRGYNNTMKYLPWSYPMYMHPPWLGRPEIHAAYRSNLLRKDPDYYGQFGWTEPDNLPYVWSVK